MRHPSTILKLLLRALIHLMFWGAVFLFFNYFFDYSNQIDGYGKTFALFLMPITIVVTYLFIYHLIPQFFLKKQYVKFTLYSIYTVIISSYLIAVSIFLGLNTLAKNNQTDIPIASKSVVFFLVGVYIVVFLISAYKFMKLQITSAKQKNVLEQKMLITELKLKEQELKHLKMQIHPHFLFNSLNTIYGFALKKDDDAPEMILRLSNLLDYLLYKVDKPKAFLIEEVMHIEDYIALEKLRFNDTLEVVFKKNTIPKSIEIPPMLLLPFVENSFKHGAIIDGKLNIVIKLNYFKEFIEFSIVNNHTKDNTLGNGIGLTNIKKRLDLLYKNAYDLNIIETERTYKVDLKLYN